MPPARTQTRKMPAQKTAQAKAKRSRTRRTQAVRVHAQPSLWQPSRTVIWLVAVIMLLAIAATGAGILTGGGSGVYPFTTLRGETVQIYGQGLYRYDTVMIGAGFRGSDLVMLLVGVPLLGYALWRYGRGSLRGGLLLAGGLAYVGYLYGSMAFGAAYNNWFVVYLALFSLALYTLIALVLSLPVMTLPAHITPGLPHRGLATFHFVVAAVLFGVWFGMSLLPALLAGEPVAELAGYTTSVTHVFDLGIVMPAALLAGRFVLRRAALGYLLTAMLLVIGWTVGLGVAAAAGFQVAADAVTTTEVLVFVVPFLLLTAVGLGLTVVFLRHVDEGVDDGAPQPG